MNEEEKIKELEKELVETINDYTREKEKNKKLEEVIDMMAEDISISNRTNWEFGCNYEIKECECMNEPVRKCGDCIKEYYFNKVKENEK